MLNYSLINIALNRVASDESGAMKKSTINTHDPISVLVTGGTGFIGSRLVSLLTAQDHVRVSLFVKEKEIILPAGVTIHTGDFLENDLFDSLTGALQGVEIVFHLAAEKRNADYMEKVNVDATRHLLEACCAAGVKALVYVSSISVIGKHAVGTVDETTPCNPITEYGRTKYEAEKLVLGYSNRLRVVALRPADVFGDGDPEQHLRNLCSTIKNGQFIYIGRRDVWQNYIYVEDCARACVELGFRLLEGSIPSGNVYIFSDPCRLSDLVDSIAGFLRVPAPKRTLALWFGWFLASLGEILLRLTGKNVPISWSRFKAMNNSVVYNSDRFKQIVGKEPFIGWREGIRRMVEWYEI